MTFNVTSLQELVREFSDEQKCIAFLEEIFWNGTPVSPFDQTSKVYKCKNNKYRCLNTGKYFNVKTGTIFEHSKIKLTDWFVAIWLFTTHKGGLSSCELSREIHVTQKTAWFMLQRIRKTVEFENNTGLDNEIELDETYVGGLNKNRHANKKVKHAQGRSCKDKVPVFGMIERGGKVVANVVNSTSERDLMPYITRTVEFTATLFTDEWVAYKNLDEVYEHFIVNHGIGQYVSGNATTNRMENFWGNFKRSIIGVYRVLSKWHLQKYVDESVFRFNTRKMQPYERFVYLLPHTNNCRLKYEELKNAC